MAVVIDADPDDARIKPLIASLTGQRPQPAHVVVGARGAVAPAGVDMVVEIEPHVVLASPEALDRIAAELSRHPAIAVYPWQKTASRYEALSTFFVLAEAMSSGAFSVFGLRPRWAPTGLVARATAAAPGTRVEVLGGGHIVAERRYAEGRAGLVDGWTRWARTPAPAHPVATAALLVFLGALIAAPVLLAVEPSWPHFWWYFAAVFTISLCLRQVGKFARLATVVYPLTLLFFLAVSVRAAFRRAG
jgi:hypothetical protein